MKKKRIYLPDICDNCHKTISTHGSIFCQKCKFDILKKNDRIIFDNVKKDKIERENRINKWSNKHWE